MFVADPSRQTSHQNIVIDPVEELLQVQVHDKLPAAVGIRPRLFQRLMRAASRAETEAGIGKGGVQNRLQYLKDGLLYKPVHHARNAELTLASSRLRDFDSTYRLGLVRPVL